FNVPGLKCAQILTGDEATKEALAGVPMAHNDSWGSLGVVAAVAAYTEGDAWLAALVERLDQQRTLLRDLLAEHLPEARMRPLEATYLAWLDLRAYGHPDPAEVILRGGVRVSPGRSYWPGLDGHVRLNIATSPERLTEIVRRMAAALSSSRPA
ncbi:MAG TPA: aminotransferase class I/II-fold pyridoxal phosphate-dependent enzyme, partial [Aquihabitans sp.]|nr:aminotransferase class I/II-fold pyridoxal phosphate-dependent enzyme [Aquihabitans sp.]